MSHEISPPPFHYAREASQELVLRIEVAQELSQRISAQVKTDFKYYSLLFVV